MQFLGPCEVCGQVNLNYRSLALHLRWRDDPAHQDMHRRWKVWRSIYRATLRCRKCGDTWEITDKRDKDKKRCPKCQALRGSLGKRRYESTRPEKIPDSRGWMTCPGSYAQWDGLRDRSVLWEPDDDLYQQVFTLWREGAHFKEIREKTGAPFSVFQRILTHAVGEDTYRSTVLADKKARAIRMAERAHALFRAMSPDEKAARFSRMRNGSLLEKTLAGVLSGSGFQGVRLNVWQAVPIEGVRVPREADLKVPIGDGRKVVVMCDGEAFHGPRFVFGDPQARVADDVATARGYFSLGYSVLRYSESEIKCGDAGRHLLQTLGRLRGCQRILRLWYPPLEEVVK